MNKFFNFTALSLMFLVFTNLISAQDMPSANDVFKKFGEALGGEETAKKITTRIIKGTVEIKPLGVTGTFEPSSVRRIKLF